MTVGPRSDSRKFHVVLFLISQRVIRNLTVRCFRLSSYKCSQNPNRSSSQKGWFTLETGEQNYTSTHTKDEIRCSSTENLIFT